MEVFKGKLNLAEKVAAIDSVSDFKTIKSVRGILSYYFLSKYDDLSDDKLSENFNEFIFNDVVEVKYLKLPGIFIEAITVNAFESSRLSAIGFSYLS